MTLRRQLLPWFYEWGAPCSDEMGVILCFPSAGGSAMMFAPWGSALDRHSVYGAQLPGRGSRLRERPSSSMGALVRDIAEVLCRNTIPRFTLFGHSMGALIAFELARELRRRNRPLPLGLIVSGTGAPHRPPAMAPTMGLSDEEFRNRLRMLDGTPPEVLENPELFQVLLPALRADFEVVERYQYLPEPPLPCPIIAFGGLTDPETEGDRLDEWMIHTGSWHETHRLPGDHFFLFKNPAAFLGQLSRALESLSLQDQHSLDGTKML